MVELLAGEASFAEVLRRDLSSGLDVIAAGAGAISGDGLDEVLDALAASYEFVVIHASDWRADLAGSPSSETVEILKREAERIHYAMTTRACGARAMLFHSLAHRHHAPVLAAIL